MFHFNLLKNQALAKSLKSPAMASKFLKYSLANHPNLTKQCLSASVNLMQQRNFFLRRPTTTIPPEARSDLDELQKALNLALADGGLPKELKASMEGSNSATKTPESDSSVFSSSSIQRTVNDSLRSDLHTAALRLFALERFVNVLVPPTTPERSMSSRLFNFFITTLIFFSIISLISPSIRGSGGLFSSDNFFDVYDPKADPTKQVKLSDVKGIDPIVTELADVIDMINNPQKYIDIGATVPRGILLTGEPGTGKTMLAKAIATECGIKFYSVSASSFETGFVGGGAGNIRAIFAAARQEERCIIFIDELDSIISRASSQLLVSGRYVMQTLNALLVEMDGFTADDRVTVIAATNFPGGIDEALKRPGRFDLQIHVPMPDLNGRMDVLRSYLAKVKVSQSFAEEDLRGIARDCSGKSAAFLADMVNTAALEAAKRFISENIWNGSYVSYPKRDAAEVSQLIDSLSKRSIGSTIESMFNKTKDYFRSLSFVQSIRDSMGFSNEDENTASTSNESTRKPVSLADLSHEQRMRYEEDANAFFAEHDPVIRQLQTTLREIELEISREMTVVDPLKIRQDERWLRVFEAIRDERERVLASQQQSGSFGITSSDLDRARELLSLGVKRTEFYNTAFDSVDRMRVAVTRIAPALASTLLPGCDRVSKVTVLPRGERLGAMILDRGSAQHEAGDEENDATAISYDQLIGSIRVALAGRAAEELIFGADNVSGESAEGLKQAFSIAQKMITKWGFSQRTGMYSVMNPDQLSDTNKKLFDDEISSLLKEEQAFVRDFVASQKDAIQSLAQLLLHEETLSGAQIQKFLESRKDMPQIVKNDSLAPVLVSEVSVAQPL